MKHKSFFFSLILIGLSVWAGKNLYQYPIFQTHDLDHHLVRTLDATVTLREGHFPLRWAGLLNFECGVPIYNFFNPLLYYLTSPLTLLTNNIMDSIKLIMLTSLIWGSLFFYLWMKNETDDLLSAFVGSLLYLYVPYRFLLIYVRGSPEYLAYAILPMVFYLYSLALKKRNDYKYLFLFSASIAGGLLSISHNIVFLLAMPIIGIYLIIRVFVEKINDIKTLFIILLSYISIIGFGSFFLIPAIFEIGYTKIAKPVFYYSDHFPSFYQMIRSSWGFGDSAPGTELDAMSFMLGYAHWLVLLVAIFYVFIKIWTNRNNAFEFLKHNVLIITLILSSLLLIFMDLEISDFIWRRIGLLKIIQFPWRILGITVFTISALSALIISNIRQKKYRWFLSILFITSALIGNRNHMLSQPVAEDKIDFYNNLSSQNYERRSITAVQDNVLSHGEYALCSPETPVVVSNVGEVVVAKEVYRGSTYGKLLLGTQVNNSGENVIINLNYFPSFTFILNGKNIDYNNCGGRMCFASSKFSEGENTLEWEIIQTPIEKTANIISISFLAGWLIIISKRFLKFTRR